MLNQVKEKKNINFESFVDYGQFKGTKLNGIGRWIVDKFGMVEG